MDSQVNQSVPLKVREKLDFKLDSGIPRFWNGGDPFKTRFFDAMSLTFPIGERFFMSSVRAFKDQITDPKLLDDVKDFMRQEGQHGIVHGQFNDLLEAQGLDIGWTQRFLDRIMLKWRLAKVSPKANIAYTAAAEHITAMMCTTLTERPEIVDQMDYRIRAMYAWHAIEEVEHKAVAFDVMSKVAKVGYLLRVTQMALFTIEFIVAIWVYILYLLKKDGFTLWERAKMSLKGFWWMVKPGGVFLPSLGYYLSYYKPGFHPWQHKEMGHYPVWLKTFEETGDPIIASQAYTAAMAV